MTDNEITYGLIGLAIGAFSARRYYKDKWESLAKDIIDVLGTVRYHKSYGDEQDGMNRSTFDILDSLNKLHSSLSKTRNAGADIAQTWARDFETKFTLEDKTK